MKALIRKAKEGGSNRQGAALGDGDGLQTASIPQGAPSERGLLALPAVLPPVLESQRVGAIASVHLLEEWLPVEVEEQLVALFRAHRSDFVQLRGKRTLRLGGNPGPPFEPEQLPPWAIQLCEVLGMTLRHGGEASAEARPPVMPPSPNHLLVNHYQPGQGIMPHTDGPAYYPYAAILSLGSSVVFDFWRDHQHTASGLPPALSLLVPPRSLLVFDGEAYAGHLHGIADRPFDTLDEAVANWGAASVRWGGPSVPDAPAWAKRQVEGAGSLRREERFSITLRHVPLSEPADGPVPSAAATGLPDCPTSGHDGR